MKNKQFLTLTISFLYCQFAFFAQDDYSNSKTDSLIKLYNNSVGFKHDSVLYEIACNIYDFSSDINVRLQYANYTFELADKTNNDRRRGASKLRIGIAYRKLGNLKQAYIEVLNGLAYYKNIHYEAGEIYAYSELSLILAEQEEYDLALIYMKKSLLRFKEKADSVRYASTSLNIGEIYRLNKNYKKAKDFSIESLNVFKEKGHQTGVGYALGNLGLIYLTQDSLAKAITKLNKSIAILEPLGDNYSTAVYYEGLAKVYQKQKKYKQAIPLAQKSLLLAGTDGLIEQIRDANLRLSEIYNDIKQYKQAHEYYLQYIVFRDSLVNEKNIREIANMRRQYEVAQKQAEVDELSKQQDYLFTLQVFQAIVVVLLLVVVFILAKYYRRKKADNKKLEQQQAELKQLNATKDKFFSIISHDLRSPVATFHGFLGLIDNMLTKDNIENIKRLSGDIRQSTKYILDLMDNLLNWALSQKGEIPYSPRPCNVKKSVDDICGVFCKTALAKGVSLTADIENDLEVFVDHRMFQSIVRNLISNALKFTLEGGSVSISTTKSNDTVILLVEDTGIGMPEEKLKFLFDLDANKSTYGTHNEKGMGLGLRLVSEFVERNNGEIHVESEEGKGTKMYVQLPVE